MSRRGAFRPRVSGGFTLIELVVTVAIVGVLAAGAVPLLELGARRAKEAELRIALRQIRGAIDAYKAAADTGQIARPEGSSGYPPSLDALVEGARDLRSPEGARIYFLRRVPRDPFAQPAELPASAGWGKRSYASPPDAPAAGADVFDVHSLAPGAGLDGVPYREW
ncbi:MAG: type II secretion system protein [Thauera sp.]|nr:type II secretion system protein [Thauera sp.]